jgi:thioredoxin 1
MVQEVTDLAAIRTGNVLVDFYATTCGPCRALNPIFEEIAREMPDVKVAKVEVTRCSDASAVYGIRCVPTVMFIQDSKVREVSHGMTTKKNIVSMVRKHLAHAVA